MGTQKINKWIRQFAALAILLVLPVLLSVQVAAIDAGISIEPILPDSQLDRSRGYFDLRLQPGAEQELFVQINNAGDSDIQITVETITASTGEEGLINYISQPEWMEPTLQYQFADLAAVPAETLIIPAGESELASVIVHMPEEAFDGVILGAIHIVQDTVEDIGGALRHQFAYAVAVQLSVSGDRPAYSFDLGDVYLSPNSDSVEVLAHIRNTAPIVVKGVGIQAVLSDMDGNQYLEYTIEGIEMAPNSIYPMMIVEELLQNLSAGSYLMKFTVTTAEDEWSLESPLVVAPDSLEDLTARGEERFQLPRMTRMILYVVGVVAAVGILAFLGLLLHIRRENKKYYAYMRRIQAGNQLGEEGAPK